MTETAPKLSIMQLILIPSVITLAITILRLVGELQNWSPIFFSREAGGGGAIVGISWLAPIFGIYFAIKLWNAGERPQSIVRVIVFAVVGILVMVAGFVIGSKVSPNPSSFALMLLIAAACIVAIALQSMAWPKLFATLLAYGYAARIPVAILMFFAIRGNWGTHYDVVPPGFPEMDWIRKWILIGAIPQLAMWIAFTVLVGILCGGIAVALRRRSEPATATASA